MARVRVVAPSTRRRSSDTSRTGSRRRFGEAVKPLTPTCRVVHRAPTMMGGVELA